MNQPSITLRRDLERIVTESGPNGPKLAIRSGQCFDITVTIIIRSVHWSASPFPRRPLRDPAGPPAATGGSAFPGLAFVYLDVYLPIQIPVALDRPLDDSLTSHSDRCNAARRDSDPAQSDSGRGAARPPVDRHPAPRSTTRPPRRRHSIQRNRRRKTAATKRDPGNGDRRSQEENAPRDTKFLVVIDK